VIRVPAMSGEGANSVRGVDKKYCEWGGGRPKQRVVTTGGKKKDKVRWG